MLAGPCLTLQMEAMIVFRYSKLHNFSVFALFNIAYVGKLPVLLILNRSFKKRHSQCTKKSLKNLNPLIRILKKPNKKDLSIKLIAFRYNLLVSSSSSLLLQYCFQLFLQFTIFIGAIFKKKIINIKIFNY